MRALVLAAGAALALSACGERAEENVDTLEVDDLVVEGDPAANGLDANGMTTGDLNATANLSVDGAANNLVQQDLTTNDADTNLANGL